MPPTKTALDDSSPEGPYEQPASCCRSVYDEGYPPDTRTHLCGFQRVLLVARWAVRTRRICSNSPVSYMPNEPSSPSRSSPLVLRRSQRSLRPLDDKSEERDCLVSSLSEGSPPGEPTFLHRGIRIPP